MKHGHKYDDCGICELCERDLDEYLEKRRRNLITRTIDWVKWKWHWWRFPF